MDSRHRKPLVIVCAADSARGDTASVVRRLRAGCDIKLVSNVPELSGVIGRARCAITIGNELATSVMQLEALKRSPTRFVLALSNSQARDRSRDSSVAGPLVMDRSELGTSVPVAKVSASMLITSLLDLQTEVRRLRPSSLRHVSQDSTGTDVTGIKGVSKERALEQLKPALVEAFSVVPFRPLRRVEEMAASIGFSESGFRSLWNRAFADRTKMPEPGRVLEVIRALSLAFLCLNGQSWKRSIRDVRISAPTGRAYFLSLFGATQTELDLSSVPLAVERLRHELLEWFDTQPRNA